MNHKFKPFEPVLVRDSYSHRWKARHFSHYCESDTYVYKTTDGNGWLQCIPFEGNEHLVGIYESPEKKEKLEFGDKVMVRNNHAPWIKAIFIAYDPDNNGYNYQVCVFNEILYFQYCRKGWDEG